MPIYRDPSPGLKTLGPRSQADAKLTSDGFWKQKLKDQKSFEPLRWPGGFSGVAAPDPIPNSAVKRPSADGTSS